MGKDLAGTQRVFPEQVLAQHVAVLGKTGSGPDKELPAYKRDPKRILCWRPCAHCGEQFPVAKKFPTARFCSRRCGIKATNPPDHNARVARATAEKRGAKQRGRGEGKSYPKLNGRHAHRVVAEQTLGRRLKPGEIVHHRDENKLNYSPDNLDVLPSQKEHARLHEASRDASWRGRKPGTLIEFKGRRQNINAWAREFRIPSKRLSWRLRQGWTIEQALHAPRHSKSRGS